MIGKYPIGSVSISYVVVLVEEPLVVTPTFADPYPLQSEIQHYPLEGKAQTYPLE